MINNRYRRLLTYFCMSYEMTWHRISLSQSKAVCLFCDSRFYFVFLPFKNPPTYTHTNDVRDLALIQIGRLADKTEGDASTFERSIIIIDMKITDEVMQSIYVIWQKKENPSCSDLLLPHSTIWVERLLLARWKHKVL